jgi:hypothetical protein
MIDRKASRQASRISVAIVASPGGATPAGDYLFSMSSATHQTSAGVSGLLSQIVTLLNNIYGSVISIDAGVASIDSNTSSIDAGVASLDGKIANPMPVLPPAGTWTPNPTAAPSDGAVISAAPQSVIRVMAANSHATDQVYLQLFDSTTVPADTTVPRLPSVPIAAGQTVILDVGLMPFSTGVAWADSTTADQKTSPAPAINALQVSAEIV